MPDAPAAAKRSWHRLYYALGAFNVVSVLVAIALGYAAMAGFSTSVDVNARWADRVGAYSELASAAMRANAPGKPDPMLRSLGQRARRARSPEGTARARDRARNRGSHRDRRTTSLRAGFPTGERAVLLRQRFGDEVDTHVEELCAARSIPDRLWAESGRVDVGSAGRASPQRHGEEGLAWRCTAGSVWVA